MISELNASHDNHILTEMFFFLFFFNVKLSCNWRGKKTNFHAVIFTKKKSLIVSKYSFSEVLGEPINYEIKDCGNVVIIYLDIIT